MIKRIRIAIDHGNRNIKTVHTVFTTGISESDISPGRVPDRSGEGWKYLY